MPGRPGSRPAFAAHDFERYAFSRPDLVLAPPERSVKKCPDALAKKGNHSYTASRCAHRLSVRTPPFHGGERGSIPLGRTIPIPSIDAWERIGSETCDWQGPSSEFRSVDPEFDPPRRSFCAPISQAAMLWFAATASGAGRLRDPPGKRHPDPSVNSCTSALTNRSVETSRRLGSCDAQLRHFDAEGAREDASARLSRRRPGFTVRHLHQDGQPPAQFGRLELTHRQCLNPCGDLPVLQACELYVSGIGASEPLRPETASGL